jgi:hypothetical protein
MVLAGVLTFCWYIWKALFGKCPYCGSTDLKPNNGLFFYCNKCRRVV